jgi:hypothetical protein
MIEVISSNIYAIVGAIFMAFLVGYINWHNNFRSRRAAACTIFRSAVLAELGSVYPNATTWPANIDTFIRSRFTALQTAVENFRPFVPWWRRYLFDRAWAHYRGSDRKIDVQVYHQYRDYSGQPDPRLTFQTNLRRLLSFANET